MIQETKERLEDVDVIHYLGNGEYHILFITSSDSGDDEIIYTVYEPICRFNQQDVVIAGDLTAKYNTTMNVSEFKTLEDAIRYSSNNSFGVEKVIDVDVNEAIKLVDGKTDRIIAYSRI